MRHIRLHTLWTASLVAGMALAAPSSAQMGPGMMGGMMGGQGTPPPGAQQMSSMMQDMATQMDRMSEQLSKGDVGPEAQQQMGQQMRQMSGMMHNMSGRMGQGMMKEPEMQQQMNQMHHMHH